MVLEKILSPAQSCGHGCSLGCESECVWQIQPILHRYWYSHNFPLNYVYTKVPVVAQIITQPQYNIYRKWNNISSMNQDQFSIQFNTCYHIQPQSESFLNQRVRDWLQSLLSGPPKVTPPRVPLIPWRSLAGFPGEICPGQSHVHSFVHICFQ